MENPVAFLMNSGVTTEEITWFMEHRDFDVDTLASAVEANISRGITVDQMMRESGARTDPAEADVGELFSCFQRLNAFQEREAEWLVPDLLPKGQICILAGDGGTAKTTLWCNLAAAVSAGTTCILDPVGTSRTAGTVAFFTSEDSIEVKLKKKLLQAGADPQRIIAPDLAKDNKLLEKLKIGGELIERFIATYQPALMIFDPIQAFVPARLNMGSRNEMRDCLQTLVPLGEKYGTTFLIISHTNKRKGAFGRDRISESSDLWDIARSVLMTGYTEEQGIRYLSNEKNNYAALQETILFSVSDDGTLTQTGTTWKRDREYAQAHAVESRPTTVKECADYIVHLLLENGHKMQTKSLDTICESESYSQHTVRRAKEQLKADGRIRFVNEGFGEKKNWYTVLEASEEDLVKVS